MLENIALGMIARSTASGWMLCVLALVGVILLGKIYMTQRPAMTRLELDGEEKLRSEMWLDIAELKKSKTTLAAELVLLRAEIAAERVVSGQQRFVLNLVVGELERLEPGNATAKQARLLLDSVQPAAFGMPHHVTDDALAEIINKTEGLS